MHHSCRKYIFWTYNTSRQLQKFLVWQSLELVQDIDKKGDKLDRELNRDLVRESHVRHFSVTSNSSYWVHIATTLGLPLDSLAFSYDWLLLHSQNLRRRIQYYFLAVPSPAQRVDLSLLPGHVPKPRPNSKLKPTPPTKPRSYSI